MTAVTVVLPAQIGPAANPVLSAPHATITHPVLGTITLPITDPATDFGDTAVNWSQIPRPRRDPLLLPLGNKLRVITLKTTLIGANPNDDHAEQLAATLQQMSGSIQPVQVSWATLESGAFQITTLTLSSVRRRPSDNHIVWATCSIELTATTSVPPVPGQPPQLPQSNSTNTSSSATTTPRRYVVQSGQTLFSIATAVYSSSLAWRAIATYNNILDPTNLPVGLVLNLPNP